MLTLKAAIFKAKHVLQTLDSPVLESELLLALVLHQNRSYIKAHPESLLTPSQQQHFEDLLAQRAAGKPYAYIAGTQEFWSLKLMVNESTLIPRPATETLIEWVVEQFQEQSTFTVADLGTGSGNIAIALQTEFPRWHLHAVDCSEAALATARKNAQVLDCTRIQFYRGNWFEAFPKDLKFNLVVSNPPYIAEKDTHLNALRYEPLSALVAAENGLGDIKNITQAAKQWLMPGAWLAIEHGYDQADWVQNRYQENGFTEINSLKDEAGWHRVTVGRLND